MAYIQQALFTLELCLKALLETTGQLVKIPDGKWKQHPPTTLFKLLNRETRKRVEQLWARLANEVGPQDGTFEAFLRSIDDMYNSWRYIPERKDANLSVDLRPVVVACKVALETSQVMFRRDSPFKPRITWRTISGGQGPDNSAQYVPIYVAGTVTSVSIPEGFDPHSLVELAIETEEYGQLTAEVARRYPQKYHGLKGRKVLVNGYYTHNRPVVVRELQRISIDGDEGRSPSYDVTKPKSPYPVDTVNLLLEDETYFTMVQCLFLTREEQEQIAGTLDSGEHLQFGDRIAIRGRVTLQDGLPVVLVGPKSIKRLAPQPDP